VRVSDPQNDLSFKQRERFFETCRVNQAAGGGAERIAISLQFRLTGIAESSGVLSWRSRAPCLTSGEGVTDTGHTIPDELDGPPIAVPRDIPHFGEGGATNGSRYPAIGDFAPFSEIDPLSFPIHRNPPHLGIRSIEQDIDWSR
jgi:hypothetical protein